MMFEFGPIMDVTDEPCSLQEKVLIIISAFSVVAVNLIPLMFL